MKHILAAGKQCSDPYRVILGFIFFPIINASSVLNLHSEPDTGRESDVV